jgi:hypothetical protein
MKSLSDLTKDYKTGQAEKRNDIVKKFVVKLNQDRVFNKMKPLPPVFYAIKMSHINVWDLEMFYKDCERAENFSRYWWGKLKIK